ncbi:hypothetical protein BFS35_000940 [Macrococcoides goetzii]|uniref:DUF4083 domain-containing protein n=1 Tax=Macrococcoides goetzii TaxID=1891097 RepID=A0A2G5NP70_9STAP|nr:hypothetical protein [Macrococcus goetzii]RAI82280.1 hypothetical protein BFS35_000940 [Macrococcus goetzii]
MENIYNFQLLLNASSSVEWGTLLFSIYSLVMMLLIISLIFYYSRRLNNLNKLDKRVRDLEKRDKRNDL